MTSSVVAATCESAGTLLQHLAAPFCSTFLQDSAPAESFFSTLKLEGLPDKGFLTRDQARDAIFECIEVCYSRKRRHSALGGVSPGRFERSAREHAA
ncbi:MAG: IS3 family transposase [Thermoanaerobaculia bacterium]|nr:MAG: IS3 family transposase [Thermoanaerobaculia bacterium]